MADTADLKRQLAEMRKALFDVGYLENRFTEVEEEHEGSITKIEKEINDLFEKAMPILMENLDKDLDLPILDVEDEIALIAAEFEFIGAKRVEEKCQELAKCNKEQDVKGFLPAYVQLKQEIETLKGKLHAYFQLAKKVEEEAEDDSEDEDRCLKCSTADISGS